VANGRASATSGCTSAATNGVAIKLRAKVLERLQTAAAHRGMRTEDLIAQVVTGVLCKGSIDKALRQCHSYELTLRALGIHMRRRNEATGSVGHITLDATHVRRAAG
jgi:hypothetical protein